MTPPWTMARREELALRRFARTPPIIASLDLVGGGVRESYHFHGQRIDEIPLPKPIYEYEETGWGHHHLIEDLWAGVDILGSEQGGA